MKYYLQTLSLLRLTMLTIESLSCWKGSIQDYETIKYVHCCSGKSLIILACASRKAMDRWRLDIGRWGPEVAIRGVSRYCCRNCPTALLSERQNCHMAVLPVWQYCPMCVLCLLPSGWELGILGNGTFLSYGSPKISAVGAVMGMKDALP